MGRCGKVSLIPEDGWDRFPAVSSLTSCVRQHLAGLVANQRVNIVRADFDRLKATLTNCVRLGPASQNREEHPAFRSHLEGRIGFVEMINPAKGKRLRATFEQIRWE